MPLDPLMPSQSYTLRIASPANAADNNGLRAIDGALLASDSPSTFSFVAMDDGDGGTTAPQALRLIDYCTEIQPILGACTICHFSPSSATMPTTTAGLALDSPAAIQMTAIGRASIEANTGPFAGAGGPTSLSFGQDMPIMDPGGGPSGSGIDPHTMPVKYPGDPSHSYLVYKTLMALPKAQDGGSPYTYSVACSDAGDPCPQDMTPEERARLSDMIIGREMPYPASPAAGVNPQGLSLGQLETLNAWISEGAPLPQDIDAGCMSP
jgi:hypothetical protein